MNWLNNSKLKVEKNREATLDGWDRVTEVHIKKKKMWKDDERVMRLREWMEWWNRREEKERGTERWKTDYLRATERTVLLLGNWTAMLWSFSSFFLFFEQSGQREAQQEPWKPPQHPARAVLYGGGKRDREGDSRFSCSSLR